MSKTNADYREALTDFRTDWISPSQFATVQSNLDNALEQLSTDKAVRSHLDAAVVQLRQQRDNAVIDAQQTQDALVQLENALDSLIPEEFVPDGCTSLAEPLCRYIKYLEDRAASTPHTGPIATVPLRVEVKVYRDD